MAARRACSAASSLERHVQEVVVEHEARLNLRSRRPRRQRPLDVPCHEGLAPHAGYVAQHVVQRLCGARKCLPRHVPKPGKGRHDLVALREVLALEHLMRLEKPWQRIRGNERPQACVERVPAEVCAASRLQAIELRQRGPRQQQAGAEIDLLEEWLGGFRVKPDVLRVEFPPGAPATDVDAHQNAFPQ
jgi:hypothetical protein